MVCEHFTDLSEFLAVSVFPPGSRQTELADSPLSNPGSNPNPSLISCTWSEDLATQEHKGTSLVFNNAGEAEKQEPSLSNETRTA